MAYLYAFDVANEVAMAGARRALADRSVPFEVRAGSAAPKDVPLPEPITLETPHLEAHVGGQQVTATVRLFAVGVVTVTVRLPFRVSALGDLHARHRATLDDGETVDALAGRLCRDVYDRIRPHLVMDAAPSEPEAYTVFLLTDLDGERDVAAWFRRERRGVAGLLNETAPSRLAEAQIEESTRIQRSFATTDLVVIDWDAALVVELDGQAEDVIYVLELANLQLEELRTMDGRLDRHLDAVYDDLERHKGVRLGIPSRTLDWLRRFRLDAAKLTEEVTNITKFFGDWYLARVHLGAQERFHLQQWRHSIDDRLREIDQMYRVIQGDVYDRRMLVLEVAIVVCFLLDLYAVFFLSR